MRFSRVLIGMLVTIVAANVAGAPPDNVPSPRIIEPQIFDFDTWIDANRILGFINNDGTVFADVAAYFTKTDGFYYPFSSIADIQNGLHDESCVYAAGLWLGGKVDGQIRVEIAEYNSEYGPGPFDLSPFGEWNPDYRVYKLYSDSLAGNPNGDYLDWPVDQGAPATTGGAPAMLGDQMLWTVFNDANANLHNNDAGSTQPLGVEIRLTAWALSDPTTIQGDAVYLKYLLYNKGGNQIDSFYISFWADPDLGKASDDLAGCDTLNDIFYCYNGLESDALYGANPPAWGGRVITGPVVPSPGDMATFDGQPLAEYRNLGMTSFMVYTNGWDPRSSVESYNCMRGLLHDGIPYDPGSGPCRFMHAGDPVLMLGDVDRDPADRRLMVSFGPLSFAPGDSQQVVLKIGARQANQNLLSIQRLKSTLLDQEETCCISPVGDVNCSLSQIADILDLTVLLDHLFISQAPLCCAGEGEIDEFPGLDIGDVEVLVNSLFLTFEPLPACP